VNLSARFIERPVATTLLTLAIALAGFFAYFKLPVAPLRRSLTQRFGFRVDAGASPETMAATVAIDRANQRRCHWRGSRLL
jgi:multidrug efflux pump